MTCLTMFLPFRDRPQTGGVEVRAVGGVFGGDLFGSLFVRAQNRGVRGGG